MSDDLFDLPRSPPPRLVELRAQYADAQALYAEAESHEDDTGEPIPKEIRININRITRALCEEEARCAQQATNAITATAVKP